VHLDNVGALSREQLTHRAAVEPQGHDHTGHSHAPGELDLDEEDEHDHGHGPAGNKPYLLPGISLALLLASLALDYFKVDFFTGYVRPIWYGIAFVLVGWNVVKAGRYHPGLPA
jgi:Cd2+/Zn2+-exporting ATPase